MAKSNFINNSRTDQAMANARRYIRGIIGKYKAEQNITTEQIIKASGMSRAAFYNCFKDPSLFRVGQLILIYDSLKVPEPERRFL